MLMLIDEIGDMILKRVSTPAVAYLIQGWARILNSAGGCGMRESPSLLLDDGTKSDSTVDPLLLPSLAPLDNDLTFRAL